MILKFGVDLISGGGVRQHATDDNGQRLLWDLEWQAREYVRATVPPINHRLAIVPVRDMT